MSICLAIADADWNLTKDVFTVVGTVVSAIGVVVASGIGVYGLLTWRRQLRGQNDHELSRRLLIQLYKFMEIFSSSRAMGIYSHEVSREGDPKFGSTVQDRFTRQELGFHRRIQNLQTSYAEISVSLFEAQALWGIEIINSAKDLSFLLDEYEEYVRLKLISLDPSEPEEDREDFQGSLDVRRSVFKPRLKQSDKFGDELEVKFRALERKLKLKLVK